MKSTKFDFKRSEDEEYFMYIVEGSYFMHDGVLFLKINPVELEDSCESKNAVNVETAFLTEFYPQDRVILVKKAIFEY